MPVDLRIAIVITTHLGAEALAKISDKFRDETFLKNGCVQTISIDAVRTRLGNRWPMRMEIASQFVHKTFYQNFDDVDHILQIDETTFLLLQPAKTRLFAEAHALALLRKVINYFLGGSLSSDLKVATVDSIGTSEIIQSFLPEERLQSTDDTSSIQKIEAEGKQGSGLNATPIEQPRRDEAIRIYSDGVFTVHSFCYPIWNINKRVVVSHLVKPVVFKSDVIRSETLADLGDLTLNERIRIDMMILSDATKILLSSEGTRFGLHVPLQQATLLSHSGRQAVVHHLLKLGDLARTVVIDIRGFEAGAPTFRIAECAAPLRGKCLGVSVQAADLSTDVSPWRSLNLSAVSVDFNTVGTNGSELRGQLREFAKRAQGVAPGLTAHSLQTRGRMLMAWAEGFTHLSGEPLTDHMRGSMTPIRYEPINLYDAVQGR